ncbi:hypothetical protein FOZ63_017711, partial [Perkinsus olseni]
LMVVLSAAIVFFGSVISSHFCINCACCFVVNGRGTLCECNHFNNYWFSVVTAIQKYAELERTGGLMDAGRVFAVEEQLPITCEVGCPPGWFLMVVDGGDSPL